MLTLKKVKELVEAPSHAKRTPSPKMLFEEGIVLLRREFDQGSHLTVYNSGYVLFSAGSETPCSISMTAVETMPTMQQRVRAM